MLQKLGCSALNTHMIKFDLSMRSARDFAGRPPAKALRRGRMRELFLVKCGDFKFSYRTACGAYWLKPSIAGSVPIA